MEAKTDKMQEMFNKDLEELKNKQTEMTNTITEMKTTLEGLNSRITEAKERISDLEDRMVEFTAAEQNKEKKRFCLEQHQKQTNKQKTLRNNLMKGKQDSTLKITKHC